MDKPKLVPALGYLGCSYSFLQTGEPATEAEEVLWQVERALKDAEISSPLGLAAWTEGELIILMVPGRSCKTNVFQVNGYEQKRFFSRPTAPGQNRGSFCDNQNAR